MHFNISKWVALKNSSTQILLSLPVFPKTVANNKTEANTSLAFFRLHHSCSDAFKNATIFAHPDFILFQHTGNQPGPPTNLVAVALSSSSIVLSWSPPTPGNFTIQGYVVHYQRQGGSEEQQILDNKTHFEFKNLYGFINYTFFVRAYGDLFGRQSKSVTQRTQEGSKLFVIWFLIIT